MVVVDNGDDVFGYVWEVFFYEFFIVVVDGFGNWVFVVCVVGEDYFVFNDVGYYCVGLVKLWNCYELEGFFVDLYFFVVFDDFEVFDNFVFIEFLKEVFCELGFYYLGFVVVFFKDFG